jgi:hypothetical protein
MTQIDDATVTAGDTKSHETWRTLRVGSVIQRLQRFNESGQLHDSAGDTLIGRREKLASAASYSRTRVERPVVLPPRREFSRSFVATARWEGTVVESFGSYFLADVIDLKSGESASVEFEYDELSDADRPLCEPGALFYWSVGLETRPSGQRVRASVVVFRRVGRRAPQQDD